MHIPQPLNLPLVLGFGIGAALVSYRFLEAPAARLCRGLLFHPALAS
ncbi:protein of unknown function [Rhodovastum atsumiense]|nr:protein of unknown function [Rhodovastum atsumiense]